MRRRTDVRSRSRNPGRRTCAAGLPLRSPSATWRSRPGVPIPSIGAVVARELDPSAGRSATRRGGGRPLTRRPITPWRPDCVSATPLRVPPPALGRSEATVPLVLPVWVFRGDVTSLCGSRCLRTRAGLSSCRTSAKGCQMLIGQEGDVRGRRSCGRRSGYRRRPTFATGSPPSCAWWPGRKSRAEQRWRAIAALGTSEMPSRSLGRPHAIASDSPVP